MKILLVAVLALTGFVVPAGFLGGSLRWSSGEPYSRDITLWRDATEVESDWTDSRTGAFEFDDLTPGTYHVSYRLGFNTDAFLPGTRSIAEASSFVVTPGERTEIDATIRPYGAAQGRLLLPDGSPARGYRAEAFMADPIGDEEHAATVAADGTWQIPDLFPEDYRIVFTNPAGTLTRSSEVVEVPSGGAATVDFTWQSGATVTVNVLEEGVGGFCATAQPSQATACTDGSTVTLRDLPAGHATISVQPVKSSDYLPSTPVTLTLTEGGAETVTVPLTLGGRLSATVLDRATGKGVRLACVVLVEPAAGGLPSEGRGEYDDYEECTNNNGKLTTYARPAGTYQLFVFGPERLFLPDDQYGHQWVGAEGGTGDQRQAVKLKIKPGRTTPAPTVLMDPPGTVTGRVTDPAGTPVGAGITHTAWPIFSRSYNGTTNDINGRYQLTSLGPYDWPIFVRPHELPEGPVAPRQWSGGTGNRYQAETVAVRSGQTSTLDITIQPFAAIAGTLTAPEGGTLIAANASTGDEVGWTRFAGSGAYRLPLVGGQRVVVRWVLESGRSGVWAEGEKVQVPKGGTRSLDLTAG